MCSTICRWRWPEGEFLALMGPSGSGKTTLLNLIAGLDRPSQGEVWVGGQLISRNVGSAIGPLAHAACRICVSVLSSAAGAQRSTKTSSCRCCCCRCRDARRKQQVLTALELVGLSDRLWHRPGQLSGGQQQRVGIARAIVTDPTLIVADEPTGDLDARSAAEILDLMGELHEALAKTIILVTHDQRAADRAHRELHLDKGQLVEQNVPPRPTKEPSNQALACSGE